MKRFYIYFLAITMSFVVIGCNSPANENQSQSAEQRTNEESDNTSDLQTELTEEDIESEDDVQVANDGANKGSSDNKGADDAQTYMTDALADSYFKEIEIEVEYADGNE